MAQKKKKADKSTRKFDPTITNKKARYNYHLLEKLEAGIALVGTEVKSLRQGLASLDEAFCRVRDGELFLVGCTIALYEHGNLANHEPTRTRKLLVHKKELVKIETKLVQKGLTLIPVRIYFNRGLAKVEIALARGTTQKDKRDKLRDRQADRDIRQALNFRR